MIPKSIVLPCGCRLDCDVINGRNTTILTACNLGESCDCVRQALEIGFEFDKHVTIIGDES